MLKEAFDECFKFKIGDVCVYVADYHAMHLAEKKSLWLGGRLATRFLIIERLAQQSPEGIHLHYVCSWMSPDGEVRLSKVMLEHELIRLPPAPEKPAEE